MPWTRQTLGVGAKQGRARFCDAKNLDDLGVGKMGGHIVHQHVRSRRSAHGGEPDKGVILAGEKIALLQHHRVNGGDTRHHGDPVARDGLDIDPCVELLHQDHAGSTHQDTLHGVLCMHVIQGGGHDHPVGRTELPAFGDGVRHEEVRTMGNDGALGLAGGP